MKKLFAALAALLAMLFTLPACASVPVPEMSGRLSVKPDENGRRRYLYFDFEITFSGSFDDIYSIEYTYTVVETATGDEVSSVDRMLYEDAFTEEDGVYVYEDSHAVLTDYDNVISASDYNAYWTVNYVDKAQTSVWLPAVFGTLGCACLVAIAVFAVPAAIKRKK